jgi:hypothetical protein
MIRVTGLSQRAIGPFPKSFRCGVLSRKTRNPVEAEIRREFFERLRSVVRSEAR